MKKRNAIRILVLTVFALVFAACYTPSPLYGSWSDNVGNKFQFNDDGTYTAILKVSNGAVVEPKTYSGNYSVAENVLTLSSDEKTIVTEWDLRGSILYLYWTEVSGDNTTTKVLALYHN